MRLLLLLSLSILCFFSCKTTSYTPEDFPESKITFGSGGGFTGMYTDYVLLENGQFFTKASSDTSYVSLSKVKKNQVAQIFDNIETLDLMSIDFNVPGNMSSYLKLKVDNKEREITWGSPGPKPPKNAKLFYSILMNLVKKNKS